MEQQKVICLCIISYINLYTSINRIERELDSAMADGLSLKKYIYRKKVFSCPWLSLE